MVQSLVDHLDDNVNESWETKQGILDTLSRCIAVAADSSLGQSTIEYSILPTTFVFALCRGSFRILLLMPGSQYDTGACVASQALSLVHNMTLELVWCHGHFYARVVREYLFSRYSTVDSR